ncbi:MAG: MAPEG family protein [Deltaproteobacteria bacterium]|nr:MAPEG family protein [Deltaproteobacteria bacterium]
MDYLGIVTVLALFEYLAFSIMVGRARVTYGIKAPATTGHEIFERFYRVHQNTLEQLVLFLPALWVFGTHVSEKWGAILGLLFIVGRAVYARGYLANPERRGIGFLIGFVANGILLIGGLVGAIYGT